MRVPIITVLIFLIVGFVCDFFLWKQVVHGSDKRNHSNSKSKRGKGRRRSHGRSCACRSHKVFWFITALCWVLMAVGLAWPYRTASIILPKMWLMFVWLTIYCGKGIYLVWCLAGEIPGIWRGKRWHTGRYVGIPMAIAGCALMWWGALVNRYNIEVKQVEIASAKLPAEFSGYRIAQLSDLHLGTWGSDTTFVSTLVDSVNALNPDLIVFTGDLVNRETSEIEPFVPVLSRLKAPGGVIAVLGNHDYGMYIDWESEAAERENLQRFEAVVHSMGWTLLRNQYMYVGRSGENIAVVGLENWGEPPYPSFGDIDKALHAPLDSSMAPLGDQWRLLLSHNPEYWDRKLRKQPYADLTLSGHTHAMQMTATVNGVMYSPAAWKYNQWGGLYVNEQNPSFGDLYINIGAGTVGMPFRIGATPEITLFILQSQHK